MLTSPSWTSLSVENTTTPTYSSLQPNTACPLDEKLTTFITPFGRFMYRRLQPQNGWGFSRINKHKKDCGWRHCIWHVREILRRCEDKGISLKFQFCQTEARFAGLKLTQHGYSISDAAIAKFPTPSTRRGQLASSLSTVLAPLRQFKERGLQLTMRQAKHALNPTKDTCLHTDASRRIAENWWKIVHQIFNWHRK